LYLQIPQGFKTFYCSDEVLHLKRTIYGLKQTALAFWKELLQVSQNMAFHRSLANPCLYDKNTASGLVLWILWVDDCSFIGHYCEVSKYHAVMNSYFGCNNIGELSV
jgi:Reverse transcriptase (RNA-dependent DNA polymerase)